MEDKQVTTNTTPSLELQTDKQGWGRKQRFWTTINAILMVVIAAAILAGINWWSSRRYFRIDCTFKQEYALSEKTKNILSNLKEPITLYVLFDRPYEEAIYQAQSKLKDLFEEYKAYGKNNFIYEEMHPAENPDQFEILKKRLKMETIAINDLVFVCGDRQKNINIVETFERTQSQGWGDPGKMKAFRGEEAVTAAILSVAQSKKPTVYFTTGHKEPEIEGSQMDPNSYSTLNAHIKRENIETKSINLLDKTEVPDDCQVLVIAGVQKLFTEPERQMLNSYLTKGGRVIILVDPMMETGLEGLLKEWGVKLDDGIVFDTEQCLPTLTAGGIAKDIACIQANTYGIHPVTARMTKQDYSTFLLARPVELEPNAAGTELVKSGPASWIEKDIDGLIQGKQQPKFDKDKDRKGPVGLAVAIYKEVPGQQSAEQSARKQTRLAVIGDSDHLRNKIISRLAQIDIFMNSLRWMLGNEVLISIEPKKAENTSLMLTPGKRSFLFWFTIIILPCVGAILGIFMWLMRRK